LIRTLEVLVKFNKGLDELIKKQHCIAILYNITFCIDALGALFKSLSDCKATEDDDDKACFNLNVTIIALKLKKSI
jgi:hypothetical protein